MAYLTKRDLGMPVLAEASASRLNSSWSMRTRKAWLYRRMVSSSPWSLPCPARHGASGTDGWRLVSGRNRTPCRVPCRCGWPRRTSSGFGCEALQGDGLSREEPARGLVGDGLARDAREHLPSASLDGDPLAVLGLLVLFVEHCHIRPVFLTGWPQRGQSPQSCASVFAVRVTASALRFAVASAGFAMPPGGTCPSPQTGLVCRVPRRTTPVPSVR